MEFLNGTDVDLDNRELMPEIERLELVSGLLLLLAAMFGFKQLGGPFIASEGRMRTSRTFVNDGRRG